MVLQKSATFEHSFEWRIVVDILPLIQNRVWIVYVFAFFLCWECPVAIVAMREGRPKENIEKVRGGHEDFTDRIGEMG